MLAEKAQIPSSSPLILTKVSSYIQFSKFRLASLVVFSAVITFVVASEGNYTGIQLWWLTVGGFLVTAASNGYNQVIEKDLDKLMERTKTRPLPTGKMSVPEGIIVATLMGATGVYVLAYYFNMLTGILGLLALVLYAAVYTPMKRKTPFAVFVGAFPGAMPPLIGWVAYSNNINIQGLTVFAVQFMWQFPHFWAIAWRLHDDYTKAGFKMLPSPGGRDKASAFQILLYSLFLIPVSLLPGAFLLSGMFYTIVAIIAGSYFAYQAYTLFTKLDNSSATKLMFGSFFYLPIVQIALLIDYYLK
ncbi:MAG: heme o synthase [Flavobacteriales bacterium]